MLSIFDLNNYIYLTFIAKRITNKCPRSFGFCITTGLILKSHSDFYEFKDSRFVRQTGSKSYSIVQKIPAQIYDCIHIMNCTK